MSTSAPPASIAPGSPPDGTPRPGLVRPPELASVVVRRAALVMVGVFTLALVLGLARMQRDVQDELDGASAWARLTAMLATAAQRTDAELIDQLRRMQAQGALRHLQLAVHDAAGRGLLDDAGLQTAPAAVVSWLDATRDAPRESVNWSLTRPSGEVWQISLVPSPRSERLEALGSAAESAALLAMLAAGTFGAIAWSVRKALRPLGAMRHAIECVERQDRDSLQRLPPMPVAELESIAGALRQMARALDEAQARQRLLSQQVLTLQEDERQRIARELHDEFGQRLTAIRLDAAWLARRLAGASGVEPRVGQVVAEIGRHCERLQHDLRDMLTRLRPVEPGLDAITLHDLKDRLESMVAAWQRPGQGAVVRLRVDAVDARGCAVGWADAADARVEAALALAVYRISQEALTNVARHAQARSVTLSVGACVEAGVLRRLDWTVEDDGVGIVDFEAAMRRGSGLAGLRERVWSAGADLRCEPARRDESEQRGLRLAARFESSLPAAATT